MILKAINIFTYSSYFLTITHESFYETDKISYHLSLFFFFDKL